MKIKKLLFLVVCAAMLAAVAITAISRSAFAEEVEVLEQEKLEETVYPEKHLILNKDGSYGGGTGAPLNGKLDHPEAGYWKINDYYNATSTETRKLIHNFRGYQQTLAGTDGLCCALMALNMFGYDTNRLYSEQRLVQRYQDANSVSLKSSRVTAEGLRTMLGKMGIFSVANDFQAKGYSRNQTDIYNWVCGCYEDNCIPMMAFRCDAEYKWYVVIGVDDMGDGNGATNVLILADPFDAYDHYQDGYRTLYVNNMLKYWLNMDEDIVLKADGSGETTKYSCENLVIRCPEGYTLDTHKGPETLESACPEVVPEVNMLKHYDEETGEWYFSGAMIGDDYLAQLKAGQTPTAAKNPWGGSSYTFTCRADETKSHLDSVYCTFNDWYNTDDNGTMLILNHYKTKWQTTASTCGVCSTLSALVYLGVPYDPTNRNINDYSTTSEYKIMKQIEKAYNNEFQVYNRGVANYEINRIMGSNYYNRNVVKSAGYNMTNYLKGTASKVYADYSAMAKQLKKAMTDKTPFLIGWNSTGGHWQVVCGYDDMGTPEIYDDFCVVADSSDRFDHFYDGYDLWSLTAVYNRWYNGSFHWNQQGIIIG